MNARDLHLLARAERVVAERFFKGASTQFMQSMFPSLSAGYDAFTASRQMQDQLQQVRDMQTYPGLMAEYTRSLQAPMDPAMGAPMPSAGPVHHRRHRHHKHTL